MPLDFGPETFLDLSRTHHPALFPLNEPVWNALGRIKSYLLEHVHTPDLTAADVSPQAVIGPHVKLGPGTVVEPFATIKGPAWIGAHCTIRSGAYIRENVIAGEGVMMGNSCEFKNCILFDEAEVPHFNYVGDSVLGHKAHLGAGVILSNVRLDRRNVTVQAEGELLDSGLRKFGGIIGDRTEIGCNSVLSPGSLVGRDCILYPGTQWRGYLESNQIVKLVQQQKLIRRR